MRGGVVAVATTLVAVAGCDLAASGLQGPPESPPAIDASINAITPADDASVPDATIDSAPADDAYATSDAGDDAGIDAPPAMMVDACAATSGPSSIAAIAPWPAPSPPTIDGDFSDWPCDGKVELTDANAAYVLNPAHPLAAQIQVRWAAQNLYLAVHIVDATVGGADPANPYNNDSVEIYVSADATLDGDYDSFTHQYVTDWKGLSVDYGPAHAGAPGDTGHAGFVEAAVKVGDGWNVEASLARPTLYATAGSFTLGTNLALDLEINDGSGTAQVAALILTMTPAPAMCACTQQECCCGKTPDVPYCDSARIGRVTLE